MLQDVSQTNSADDPVAKALEDPATRTRLLNAARAFLSKRLAGKPLVEQVALAEEIVQEAQMRAWTNRHVFDPLRDVVTWLVGYVRNITREYIKKLAKEPSRLPDDGPGLEEFAVDPARPIDDLLSDREMVKKLFHHLSPKERLILQMKYWDGMTAAEIGHQLGLQENAVRRRVFRIIEKLQKIGGVSGEGQP